MAKPASTAAANYQEPDFKKILEKEATATQQHFHDWVLAKTEYDPSKAKSKAEAFAEGIRIGTALRGIHQASPENQERLAAQRAAKAEADTAKASEEKPAKAAKATAAPAKAAKASKAAAPAVVPAEAPAEEAAPAAKRAPAKRGGRRGGASTSAAPF